MQSKTHNLAEFQEAARDFALGLTLAPDRAIVVGLYGDLGAGKTTFVQAVAKALGISETVNSPTFLIQKRYKIQDSRFMNLIHIDAYRLKSSAELARLRFDELLADPQNLILVEWADKVTDVLPQEHMKIRFRFIDDSTREISID